MDNHLQSKSVSTIDDILSTAYTSPLTSNPRFKRELEEVSQYYQFYEGWDTLNIDSDYGQGWKVEDTKAYTPSRDLRNYTKRLIRRQAEFMMGKPPVVTFMPATEGEQADKLAEDKQIIFEGILESASFWKKASKAFLDATVGKRVLMVAQVNGGEPVGIKFFPMPQFDYTVNPDREGELQSVSICYIDENSRGKATANQLWHNYLYEMRDGSCWLTYQLTDGDGADLFIKREQSDNSDSELTHQVKEARTKVIINDSGLEEEVPELVYEEADTGLSQIPCKVILNDPLTNDIYGSSDVKELMEVADNYNRTVSDFRDALRFKMFEQTAIIDGDSKSIEGMMIAPNAVVDIKSDKASMTGKQAQITTISGSFDFKSAAEFYLNDAKRAMYELMAQPFPEKVQDAPSGVAMEYLFYELMSRCDWKWTEWDDAIAWLIQFLEEALAVIKVDFSKIPVESLAPFQTLTTESIEHFYPLPEDKVGKRTLALDEVKTSARSRASYIAEFGNHADNRSEWEDILKEARELEDAQAGVLPTILDTMTKGETNDQEQKEAIPEGQAEAGN